MDKNLVVVKEHLPQRCEICHQSDLFVANLGKCERCKNLSLEIINNQVDKAKKNNTLLWGIIVGLLLAIFFFAFVIMKMISKPHT